MLPRGAYSPTEFLTLTLLITLATYTIALHTCPVHKLK